MCFNMLHVMEKKKLKRSTLLPIALFCGGLAFYIYYGITWNAWMQNLPNILIYVVIIVALWWSLKKKEEIKNRTY